MLERLSQAQFEHIIDVLILYKQLSHKKVTLSEKSIKEAFHFMRNQGKDLSEQLGMNIFVQVAKFLTSSFLVETSVCIKTLFLTTEVL